MFDQFFNAFLNAVRDIAQAIREGNDTHWPPNPVGQIHVSLLEGIDMRFFVQLSLEPFAGDVVAGEASISINNGPTITRQVPPDATTIEGEELVANEGDSVAVLYSYVSSKGKKSKTPLLGGGVVSSGFPPDPVGSLSIVVVEEGAALVGSSRFVASTRR